MRDPSRIKLMLDVIEKIWSHYPDLRFNQLISNLQYEYCKKRDGRFFRQMYEYDGNRYEFCGNMPDLFHLEDGEFYKFLHDELNELQQDGVNP